MPRNASGREAMRAVASALLTVEADAVVRVFEAPARASAAGAWGGGEGVFGSPQLGWGRVFGVLGKI